LDRKQTRGRAENKMLVLMEGESRKCMGAVGGEKTVNRNR